MLEFLALITQRPVVIVLAITGALLVTAGSYMAKPDKPTKASRSLTVVGYVLTVLSVLLFIIAGFMSDQ